MKINELFLKTKNYLANITLCATLKTKLTSGVFLGQHKAVKFLLKNKRYLAVALSVSIIFIVVFLNSFPQVTMIQETEAETETESEINEPEKMQIGSIGPESVVPESIEPREDVVIKSDIPEELPILDLSGLRSEISSDMPKINEPAAWGDKVLYSAGNAGSLDQPVLTRLFLYDTLTQEEQEVAVSNVRFGELYEGRLSESWIVWLDTNQGGINHIYAMNRLTGEQKRVDSSSLNRPQLALWGDYIIWSGQKEELIDEMHVFNLVTGRSVKIEEFDNPTFGTSSPAIHHNLLVWAYSHPDDPISRSVIKTLDITTLNLDQQIPTDLQSPSSDLPDAVNTELIEPSINIQVIDPQGFAIYPATNGKAFAWLDNLNPAQANLKLTFDNGETIVTVAEGVGRFFGIGDEFIVYTQQGTIMMYFWNSSQYARLTKEGEQGKLAELPVSGRSILWYDSTDPNRREDIVNRSIIESLP